MSPSETLVSVIIPLYNHANYIEETLRSVLAQTHNELEVIVIDDGSTDDSLQIAQRVAASDARVQVLSQVNLGPSSALNAGLRLAKGEYVATLSSDDTYFLEKIERQLDYLKSHPECSALFTHVDYMDAQSKDIPVPVEFSQVFNVANRTREAWLKDFIVCGNMLNAPSAIHPRWVFEKIGAYHPGLIQLQDWDFYIRCLVIGEIHILQEKLLRYRVRPGENLSAAKNQLRTSNEMLLVAARLLSAAQQVFSLSSDQYAAAAKVLELARRSAFAPMQLAALVHEFNLHSESVYQRGEKAVENKRVPRLKDFHEALRSQDFSFAHEVQNLRVENRGLSYRVNILESSYSYRLGRILTWPIRMAKRLMSH